MERVDEIKFLFENHVEAEEKDGEAETIEGGLLRTLYETICGVCATRQPHGAPLGLEIQISPRSMFGTEVDREFFSQHPNGQ